VPKHDSRRRAASVKALEVQIRPGCLWDGCKPPKWTRAKPRMKTASGEFRRGFFGFSKIRYMVWSRDSKRWRSWGQRSKSWHKNEIHHELNKQYYGVSVSHATLCIITHEHVWVDDTLFASLCSGVDLVVCCRSSGCWWLLTWSQSQRTTVIN